MEEARELNMLDHVKANFKLLLREELQNRGKHTEGKKVATREYSKEQRKYLEGLGIKTSSKEWVELVGVITQLLKENFPDELVEGGELEWEEKGRQLFQ
ncbi:MAG: hypothetical protein HOA57_02870 [Candidatus Magasanikbacteria bacterium]|jgi:hypothetical protein|nr:hypothetical protein [Candidatus Magasanikbacteria bacterium]MBT4315354.1 hypothetical protein [Candidatus Magasanikbacteria bacterium]MBT4547227.1 hypothetical protein [Candidatus Magasanikbacteria bacterium]MBT6819296.1 hypothetical protein [Candidatus Magasanikbacteria bacterium]